MLCKQPIEKRPKPHTFLTCLVVAGMGLLLVVTLYWLSNTGNVKAYGEYMCSEVYGKTTDCK